MPTESAKVAIAVAIIGGIFGIAAALISSRGDPKPGPDPPRPMGTLQYDTNLGGGDLTLDGFEVATPQSCSDRCSKEALCKSMTYVKITGKNAGVCWLKGTVPNATHFLGDTSAVKL